MNELLQSILTSSCLSTADKENTLFNLGKQLNNKKIESLAFELESKLSEVTAEQLTRSIAHN